MKLPRTLPIKRAAHVYLVRDGQLLLVAERMGDGSIFYGLPGGKAEPGESLASAALRQVRFETGLSVGELEFVSLLEGALLEGTPHECFATFARFTAQVQPDVPAEEALDPDVVGTRWVPLPEVVGLVRYGPRLSARNAIRCYGCQPATLWRAGHGLTIPSDGPAWLGPGRL
ncbi:NUDIX domain-containing protein [Deinococcus lacus]|uniref:NUDIX domain-containing protein n=1 Tax=Deinococcus lacus TaxID=392561 RepID=A0ABW1YDU7_9DEIO